MRIHLVTNLAGGAGRSLTAALLALGLQASGRRSVLVQQVYAPLGPPFEPVRRWPIPLLRIPFSRGVADEEGDQGDAFRVNIGVGQRDPFVDTLALALKHHVEESGPVDHVIVDLPPITGALTCDLMRIAACTLIPVRSSPLAVEDAIRTAIRMTRIVDHPGVPGSFCLVPIATPEDQVAVVARLRQFMVDLDPASELWDADRLAAEEFPLVPAPFLSRATLMDLAFGVRILSRSEEVEACRLFVERFVRYLDEEQLQEILNRGPVEAS